MDKTEYAGSNRMDEHGIVGVGRQAARSQLELAPQFDAAVQRMSVPNGAIFSAWTLFHIALWAVGFAAVIYFRGQPLIQLALAVWLGSQLHTLTILQHDCGHRSAYGSPRANLWVGRFLAWFIYMPFTTFTELHRWHHGSLGEAEKDPDEWFYEGGRAQLFLRECLFMPRFIFLSLTRKLMPEARRRVINELSFNTFTYALLIVGLYAVNAVDVLVFAFLIPLLMLGVVYNPISRGYEHYPLACMSLQDARRTDLRFNTVTVTNRLIGFLWANIIYHVEHHMYPRVPFYRLSALHRMFAGKPYLIAAYPLSPLRQYRSSFSEILKHTDNTSAGDSASQQFNFKGKS